MDTSLFDSLFRELEKKSIELGLRKAACIELENDEAELFKNVSIQKFGKSSPLYLIANNNETLVELSNTSMFDRKFGLTLGYPECCVDAYLERDLVTKNNFPIYSVLSTEGIKIVDREAYVEFNPFCFVFNRHVNLKFIPHTPCSFKCEHSIELGLKWFNEMRKLNKDLADGLLNTLNRKYDVEILSDKYIVTSDDDFKIEMKKVKEKSPEGLRKIHLMPCNNMLELT